LKKDITILKIFIPPRVILIYSKTAIQAVKKGAAKSGSPTLDGQGEKVLKSRWQPRNGCDGWSMAKNFNNYNSGQFVSSSQLDVPVT